jgi:hypothetical protein
MARREQTQQVRVYTYDCIGPIQGAEIVSAQAHSAHRYYNKLVEIERERREKWDAMRLRHCPELVELEARIAELGERIESAKGAINADKASARTRKVDPEKAETLKALKAERKPLYAAMKLRKAEFNATLDPGNKAFKERVRARLPKKDDGEPNDEDVHAIQEANETVLAEMIGEPEWSEAWKESVTLSAQAKARAKAARAESGLLKGTYDLVDAAFAQAKTRSKNPPRFHRWDGNGRIGVRLCVPVEEVLSGTTGNLRIIALPADTWETRSARRKARTRVRLSLGRGVDTVDFPIMMHRPLPKGGTVRAAWIRMTRIGRRTRYALQLTIEGGAQPASERPRKPRADAVALNLGWRLVRGGLRVGYWVGTDGRSGEILIPDSPPENKVKDGERRFGLLQRLDYPYALKAIKDRLFNFAHAAITAERKAGRLPAWPDREGNDQLAHVHSWKSAAKLDSYARHLTSETLGTERTFELWTAWRKERLLDAADDSRFVSRERTDSWTEAHGLTEPLARLAFWLECWRRQDMHLYDWISAHRERALLHRRELFRIAARRLADEYDRLVIEDFDLRRVKEKPSADKESEEREEVKRRLQLAAPGELRSAVTMAFGGDKSARVVKVDAKRNSALHVDCGAELDGGEARELYCPKCRLTVERDENNCRNQLQKATVPGA